MLQVVLGVAAVAAGAYVWLSEKENESRQKFEKSSKRLKARVKEMDSEISDTKKSVSNEIYFEKYIKLYQASVQNSNAHFLNYKEYKKLVKICRTKRNEIGEQIAQLKEQRQNTSGQQRRQIIEQLNQLYTFIDEIKMELTRLHEKKKELYALLQQINNQTHELKMTIRSQCGYGGYVWYEKRFGYARALADLNSGMKKSKTNHCFSDSFDYISDFYHDPMFSSNHKPKKKRRQTLW